MLFDGIPTTSRLVKQINILVDSNTVQIQSEERGDLSLFVAEIDHLRGISNRFELGFVGREATPESAMKLGIQLLVTRSSLPDLVAVPGCLGVDRRRSTVHNGVRNADFQPTGGKVPNHVAIGRNMIQLNDQRYWL